LNLPNKLVNLHATHGITCHPEMTCVGTAPHLGAGVYAAQVEVLRAPLRLGV